MNKREKKLFDNQDQSYLHGKRGFASMNKDRQREIAVKGINALREQGKAYQFDSETAKRAGKLGGSKAKSNRNKNKIK